jgi:drug/metabolite transporter (DMT)-like permease
MSDRRYVVMCTLAAASWGTWSLILRPTGLPATVTAPLMFATMGVCALPAAWRAPAARWDREAVVALVANAMFDAANVLAFFAAMNVTTVAIAVLTHYLAPIVIALAAGKIDGESPPGTRPAAAVALVGLAIVLEPWRQPADGALLGALLGLVSAVCYAGAVFASRRLGVKLGTARAVAGRGLLAAALMFPLGARGILAIEPGQLARVVFGGATTGALAGMMFVASLTRIGAARAAVLTFAEPLVAVAVGVLAWHEPLRPLAALGGALVLAAGVHVARQAG